MGRPIRLPHLAALFVLALPLAAAPPQRIISTSPAITETLFALGLGDRVVGVTEYCRYPEEARRKPRIGSFLQPNIEAILVQHPDLVIAERLSNGAASRLRSLNLRVTEVGFDTVDDILRSTRTIATAAGVSDRGEQLARTIRQQLDTLRQRTAALPRRSLLFVVGRTPGRLQGLVAVGGQSHLNTLIEAAGGRNIFADTAAYPAISLEEVLSRNPDVIIDMGEMADTAGVTDAQKKAVVALWRQRASLKAVRENRVHAVASDLFVVPGPRIAEAAALFARLLHPEAH